MTTTTTTMSGKQQHTSSSCSSNFIRTAAVSVGFGIFLLLTVGPLEISCSSGGFNLDGRWREDQYQRTGLNNYLYAVDVVGFFRRFYITTTNWENEQSLYHKSNVYRVNGFKGPQSEVYSYLLTADNKTVSSVDLGYWGGLLEAVTEVDLDGESLVSYFSDPETNKTKIVSKRTRAKGSKLMVHEFRHLESDAVTKSFYYKQG